MPAVATEPPRIRVRRHRVEVPPDLPRHWHSGSALLTHAANALNLVFPAGERFFVRSVRHYVDQLDDPELLERVRAFVGQETQHGRAHELAFRMLDDQGFVYRDWLAWYERVAYGVLEPAVPPIVCLSVTVALEHLTATLATDALEQSWLDEIPPMYGELLGWHSCEEIEHKAVAFEVFQAVDGRWGVRVAGMGLAVGAFLLFWTSGIRHLTRQDPEATRARLRRERAEAHARGQDRSFLRRAFRSYLRRDFHPDHIDNRGLAEAWLRAHGRWEA
ncbi:MAG: metal-dependent hydrolase [Alphaproteobacteria bacterium]|nr:metal-dependent hydrolase [Alphaproteobacteria bacterium]